MLALDGTYFDGSDGHDNYTALRAIITDGALGGSTSIVKSGSGEWVLTGTNFYSGSTTINGGTLLLAHGDIGYANGGTGTHTYTNVLPASTSVTIAANAELELYTGDSTHTLEPMKQTIGALSGGTLSIISLNAGTLTVNNAGAATFDGLIRDTYPDGTCTNQTGGHFAKSNTGTLVLGHANTYTGGTTVSGGVLVAAHPAAFGSSTFTTLSIGTGATARLNVGLSTAMKQGTLSFAGGTGTLIAGKLDMNDNDLVLTSGSLSTVTAQIKNGLENGGAFDWQGQGISSTKAGLDNATAGSFLYALGVLWNDLSQFGGSGPIYTSFSGVSLTGSEVLVKFTYFGDADLSGMIDASDYSLIDNGYVNHLSGWVNGDFDYSGTIDATDYALIDNAYVNQNGALAELLLVEHARLFGGRYEDALSVLRSGHIPEPRASGLGALVWLLDRIIGQTRRRRSNDPRVTSGVTTSGSGTVETTTGGINAAVDCVDGRKDQSVTLRLSST